MLFAAPPNFAHLTVVSNGAEDVRSHRRQRLRRAAVHCAAAGVLLTPFFALIANTAYADLTLCNSTSSRVGVSVGYQDKQGWSTEGWWNIASQTCETLLKGTVPSRFIYVHAVDYDRGGEWAE
ncbi:MAG: DUF1036 domain-containing protein, partial [Hyphomicrobiaceae bacterium]|nr:DUF1036 domain-containing protein [Hyphomicrobiaceae bacterium]